MTDTVLIEDAPTDSIQPDSSFWFGRSSTFQTTQWTMVSAAGQGSATSAELALEQLCRAYWFPLYAFVRRCGHSTEDAQDLTQEFFARYLAKNYFALADRTRGRFRSFLLSSLKHFLNEKWRHGRRQKRDGGKVVISLELLEAEKRYHADSGTGLSPDRIFERRWAEALLQRVLARLREDYSRTGRAAIFEQLQQFLWGRVAALSYAEIGSRLDLNESAVKVAVHRLRQRFRGLLREEVARTVGASNEIDDELKHLMHVFGR